MASDDRGIRARDETGGDQLIGERGLNASGDQLSAYLRRLCGAVVRHGVVHGCCSFRVIDNHTIACATRRTAEQ
jgi:hypothetical protein